MSTILDSWRQAHPEKGHCHNCGTFGHVAVPPHDVRLRYCFVCMQAYPDSVSPQLKVIVRLFSILLEELKPPKKPKVPRQPKAKLSVMPMAPRKR